MIDALSEILLGPAAEVAPHLLGCHLVRELDGRRLVGRIVEVEAYDQSDAASHSYRGRTPRTDIMFGPPGHLYVYFTYGMHYCCNVVTGPPGQGAAVLIRALEPLEGDTVMSHNRGGLTGQQLTNGPAKLCQALAIDKALNGHDLHLSPLRLELPSALPPEQIIQTKRVGISRATEVPWRFYLKDNPFVSRA
jgi:DNA-3-methyladenine glycosylase